MFCVKNYFCFSAISVSLSNVFPPKMCMYPQTYRHTDTLMYGFIRQQVLQKSIVRWWSQTQIHKIFSQLPISTNLYKISDVCVCVSVSVCVKMLLSQCTVWYQVLAIYQPVNDINISCFNVLINYLPFGRLIESGVSFILIWADCFHYLVSSFFEEMLYTHIHHIMTVVYLHVVDVGVLLFRVWP